jgi:hypothetical protein
LNLATPGYECYELFYDLFLESELKSNDVQNTDNTQKAHKSLQGFEKVSAGINMPAGTSFVTAGLVVKADGS